MAATQTDPTAKKPFQESPFNNQPPPPPHTDSQESVGWELFKQKEESPAEVTDAKKTYPEAGEAERCDGEYRSAGMSGGPGKRRTYTEAATQPSRVLRAKGQ